jgi:HEAT repeat protein
MSLRGPSLALTPAELHRIADVTRLAQSGSTEDLGKLLDMLTDPSWTVRREVVAALGRMGKPSVLPLADLLRNRRDNETRIAAAVDALVASGDDVFAEVSELAADADPAIVADAAQILGRRRSGMAVPLLASLVDHPSDNVAVAAIEALGWIGGPRAVQTLITAVRSANFFRVFPAIDVLGRSADPRAIPPLTALLADPTYRMEAARALGKTGEAAAIAPLASLLSHPSEATVRLAASALWELQSRHVERYGSSEVVEEILRRSATDGAPVIRLTRCLTNADAKEQEAIAFVLGVIGGEAAMAGLRGLLDASGPAADLAGAALKKMGRESDVHLRDALREGNSARRRVVLPLIGRATASPELIECLSDADAEVRALACDALARVGAVNAVTPLFHLLEDANARVVQAAMGAIQSLGNVETQPLALAAAESPNPSVRRSALRILAYFGFPEALSLFLKATTDDDPRMRDAALTGLTFLDDPRALEALLEAARSPLEKTRSAAMRALGQCPKRDARIPSYLLVGLKDPGAWVRYYACQALGRLGMESATDSITSLLDDPAGQVRVAAVEALSHFPNELALFALRRAAEAGEPDIQRAALIGLGLAKRPEGVAVLLKAVQSPDAATRLVAISALADSGSPHALPALATAARDVDENVRASAVGFLAAVPAPEGTAVLIDLLHDAALRERVVPLLSVSNEGRVAGIMAALATADEETAPLLTSALARMRTAEAQTALAYAMSMSWVPARKASASALAALRTPEAFAILRKAAETDADPQVRQISAVLLGQ